MPEGAHDFQVAGRGVVLSGTVSAAAGAGGSAAGTSASARGQPTLDSTGASEERGPGGTVVLLHGLTATRRYVTMGSRALERAGHRTIAYDARGHGRSSPAPSADAYTYPLLADDLRAVLDALAVGRATLVGASMGAHTALRFALEHPERVAALALITPAFDPGTAFAPATLAGWDRLARGLEQGGVGGFLGAYDLAAVPAGWRDTVERVLRQRLAAHEHPSAIADALRAVPRSAPFDEWARLQRIAVPTLVVGSRDEADPGHPLATAERYLAAIPGARLRVEDSDESPLAWQGGRLSALIAELADSAV